MQFERVMQEEVVEECPVCFRVFSAAIVPTNIVCGHCFCAECSTNLKRCPICRKKLIPGYQRTTNYSLLSLLERLSSLARRETRSQQVQTDYVLSPSTSRARRVRSEPQPGQQVQQTVRVSDQLTFRFGRNAAGGISRLEVRLK